MKWEFIHTGGLSLTRVMVSCVSTAEGGSAIYSASGDGEAIDCTGNSLCREVLFLVYIAPVNAAVVIAGIVFAVVAVALIILMVLLIACFLKYHSKGKRTMCAVQAGGTRNNYHTIYYV